MTSSILTLNVELIGKPAEGVEVSEVAAVKVTTADAAVFDFG